MLLAYEFDDPLPHIVIPICVFTDNSEVFIDALWDTGATTSSISYSVAEKLGLQPVSQTEVSDMSGIHFSNVYEISMILSNGFSIGNVKCLEFDKGISPYDFVIGMDIIQLGDFSLKHCSGKTIFVFERK